MKGLERRDSGLEIAKLPPLKIVFDAHQERLKNPEAELLEGLHSEEELEHRHRLNLKQMDIRTLADLGAFFKLLGEMPGVYARSIEQVNLVAKDENAENTLFRIRRTRIISGKDAGQDEDVYRIALKTRTKQRAKEETQLIIRNGDPKTAKLLTQTIRLFKKGFNKCERTRYYYLHKLPNEHTCEIHVEIYKEPPELAGLVRIEVEYLGEHKFQDAKDVKNNSGWLPEWVGKSVTGQSEWTNIHLVSTRCMPKSALRELRDLKKASKKAAQKGE